MLRRISPLALGLLLWACDASSSSVATPRGGAASSPAIQVAYAPGAWRRASPERVAEVSLYFSHLLVRHDEVATSEVAFGLGGWHYSTPPGRPRAEARERAEALSVRLRREPEAFVEVAREQSDDVATRALGGSLNGISSLRLIESPELLDALDALDVGEVSKVVESPHGYHVLIRNSPPQSRELEGARLVIAHDDARWLHRHLARGAVASRTRAEALELAQNLRAQLDQAPERFDELVRRHSDHREAERGGDFGRWSTRERSPFHREVDALSRLEEGEISPPLDTLFGIQLVRRTRPRARAELAMQSVDFHFDAEAPPGAPGSQAEAGAIAQRVAEQLAAHPERLASLQARYCCAGGASRWSEGRGLDELTRVLKELEIGETAKRAVRVDDRFVVVRRIDPSSLPMPRREGRLLDDLVAVSTP